jgi:preprotein translocase subunit SecG
LSRSTAIFAAIFMLNSLALAWLGTRATAETSEGLLGASVEQVAPVTSAPTLSDAPPVAPEQGQ